MESIVVGGWSNREKSELKRDEGTSEWNEDMEWDREYKLIINRSEFLRKHKYYDPDKAGIGG
jgi:hypothetical protein